MGQTTGVGVEGAVIITGITGGGDRLSRTQAIEIIAGRQNSKSVRLTGNILIGVVTIGSFGAAYNPGFAGLPGKPALAFVAAA